MRRLFIVPFLLLVVSCTQPNPVQTAQTLEQKAAAVYGQFVIAQEAARDIVCPNYVAVRAAPAASVPCQPTVPKGVVRAIASAENVAKPLADVLAVTTRQYAQVKAAQGTGAQVVAAFNALQAAYSEALPSVMALISAVKAQKEPQ